MTPWGRDILLIPMDDVFVYAVLQSMTFRFRGHCVRLKPQFFDFLLHTWRYSGLVRYINGNFLQALYIFYTVDYWKNEVQPLKIRNESQTWTCSDTHWHWVTMECTNVKRIEISGQLCLAYPVTALGNWCIVTRQLTGNLPMLWNNEFTIHSIKVT